MLADEPLLIRYPVSSDDFLSRWVGNNPWISARQRRLMKLYINSSTDRGDAARAEGLPIGKLVRSLNTTGPALSPVRFAFANVSFEIRGMRGLCDDVYGERYAKFGTPLVLRLYLTDSDGIDQRVFEAADWNFMDMGFPGFIAYVYGVFCEDMFFVSGMQSDLAARYTYIFRGKGGVDVRSGDEILSSDEISQVNVDGATIRTLRRRFIRRWREIVLAAIDCYGVAIGDYSSVALHEFPLDDHELVSSHQMSRIYRSLPGRFAARRIVVETASEAYKYTELRGFQTGKSLAAQTSLAGSCDTAGMPVWSRYDSTERLAINYTLRCNLSCAHCNVAASPRQTARLSDSNIDAIISWAFSNNTKHLTLSGGEVLLYPDRIANVVEKASIAGLEVDIETNGFWARSEASALNTLVPLWRSGARGIVLSYDTFHAREMPIDRVLIAYRVARSLGFYTEVNFCGSDDPEWDNRLRDALTSEQISFIENPLLDIGRGVNVAGESDSRSLVALPDCDSLTMTINATGDVFACCEIDAARERWKPVWGGNAAEHGALDAVARTHRLLTQFYEKSSPLYFRRLVEEHPAFAELREMQFTTICDFCRQVFTGQHGRERLDVLSQASSDSGF